ncbi:MAG: ECF-type sigma factor [Longimicrobiales bacterium]
MWEGDETLQTAALVHEAYLKLVGQSRIGATSRAHFPALAARAMRHILCNYARDRRAQKRGGGLEHLPFDELSADAARLAFSAGPSDVARLAHRSISYGPCDTAPAPCATPACASRRFRRRSVR